MKETETVSKEIKKEPVSTESHAKYMGLFLIVGSLTLFTLWFVYDFLPAAKQKTEISEVSKGQRKSGLQKLWEADIKKMYEENVFHKGLSSIRMVRVFMLDENLHAQFKHLKTPFKQKKNGQNLLEVSFMSHHSDLDESEKIIVQYNLTDKDSGNMFWEYSRTLTVPEEMLAD